MMVVWTNGDQLMVLRSTTEGIPNGDCDPEHKARKSVGMSMSEPSSDVSGLGVEGTAPDPELPGR